MKKLAFAISVLTIVAFAGCAQLFDGMIETVNPDGVANALGSPGQDPSGSAKTVDVLITVASDWTMFDLQQGPLLLALAPIVGGSTTDLLWSARSVVTLGWNDFRPDSNGFMAIRATVAPGTNYSYKLVLWQPRSGSSNVITTSDPAAFVLFNVPHGSAPTDSLSPSDLSGGSSAGYQLLVSERFTQAEIDQINPPTAIDANDMFQINIDIDRSDNPAFAGRNYRVTIKNSGTATIGTMQGNLDSQGRIPPATLSSPAYTATVGGGKFFLTVDVDTNGDNGFGAGDSSYSLSHFIVNKTASIGGVYQYHVQLDSTSASAWLTL
jgi:hypothetical protein